MMNTDTLSDNAELPWAAAYADAGIVASLPAPAHASVAEFVHERCEYFAARPEKHPAFTCVMPNGMNGRLSFAAVDAHSDAFAGFLRGVLGLNAGDRVAVQLPNSLAYPVVAFGVMKAGCVLVNTNPLYTPTEMIHQFSDAGARVLVVVDLFADKLPEVIGPAGIEHVVLARVDEFFPTVPSWVIRGVQKWWNRSLPPVTVSHVKLQDTLAQGRITHNAHPVQDYWSSLGHNDLVALQYTGGTTGVSKGAMLSNGNLLNNVNQMHAMGASHMEEAAECVLTALPLYHVFAFTSNLLGFLNIGAHNVLIPNPRPVKNLQRAMENYPISWMSGVNTLFNALLNEEWFLAYPPKRLKAAIAGGTALHTAVADRWLKVTNTPIGEGYGLTETSPIVSVTPLQGSHNEGGIGIPAPGTLIRLNDEHGRAVAPGEPGEICVKGPQVMQGYWRNELETTSAITDGWFATGDIAVMASDGFMHIVDRKKDLILVSGFNVYPNEIENVITQLDGVLEAAVVGVNNDTTGEAVKAFVVLDSVAGVALTEAEIISHCRSLLTAYKVPSSVHLRKELPKTPVGKVLRKALREELEVPSFTSERMT